ncbi:MAG: 3-oxoacyl-ACP reductase FabG [FCB group bacterium]|nr:3-oxoacyl-ACP reductase FabG [FCB group bacterium]
MSDSIFNLEGKVAIVTGGSRGLGKAMALGLADAGADVVVASRTQADLDKVAEEIKAKGRKALAIAMDATNFDSIKAMAAKVVEEFGKIDILINNAGFGTTVPFLKIAEEDWDRLLNINLKGYFMVTQAVGAYMFKAKAGRVINISSAMGESPMPFMAHYAASKGAINAMTKSLAQEWARRGITVNAIAPSYFLTDMNKSAHEDEMTNKLIMSKTPVGRWGEANELVGLTVYLSSDNSAYLTGAIIPVDGGWASA